jgi:hypothetical protein
MLLSNAALPAGERLVIPLKNLDLSMPIPLSRGEPRYQQTAPK